VQFAEIPRAPNKYYPANSPADVLGPFVEACVRLHAENRLTARELLEFSQTGGAFDMCANDREKDWRGFMAIFFGSWNWHRWATKVQGEWKGNLGER
jgi:hypothetical protein